MEGSLAELTALLERETDLATVLVTHARGSTPREAGARMLAGMDALHGTIGGGQLEHRAVEAARGMLAAGGAEATLTLPLGPAIGQCCGGWVEVAIKRVDAAGRQCLLEEERARRARAPQVLICGAGHLGRALAGFFALLPVRTVLIDPRAEELALCTAPVEQRHTALPEAEIRAAPPGSAFIVATHDHALDFLIASEALARGDAAYVGLIGSATKRVKFERFCRRECGALSTAALTCPIGAAGSADKRPAVIAAFVAAEVTAALTRQPAERTSAPTLSAVG